jgi:hypothetical protein
LLCRFDLAVRAISIRRRIASERGACCLAEPSLPLMLLGDHTSLPLPPFSLDQLDACRPAAKLECFLRRRRVSIAGAESVTGWSRFTPPWRGACILGSIFPVPTICKCYVHQLQNSNLKRKYSMRSSHTRVSWTVPYSLCRFATNRSPERKCIPATRGFS